MRLPASSRDWSFCQPRFIVIIAGVLFCVGAFALAQDLKSPQQPPGDDAGCAKSLLVDSDVVRHGELVGNIPVWQLPGGNAFFFEAGMYIDADGAPNAYSPDDTGIDDLRSAGEPGDWEGLAKDDSGNPYVQGPNDPFPGFYVSETALEDHTKSPQDPSRYVDATKIPYIVLQHEVAHQAHVRLGDLAAVFNLQNGKSSAAIFADTGENLGEGSVALADALEIRSSARYGGQRGGILYTIFPGSGNGKPRSADEISTGVDQLLKSLGGPGQFMTCSTNDSTQQASAPVF